jgi:hypothetical protein
VKGTASGEKEKSQQVPDGVPEDGVGAFEDLQERNRAFGGTGIHRTQLYKWRDRMEPVGNVPDAAANSGERELRKQIRELKRVLGEKAMEADFFKGALQKVEARRQNSGGSGGTVFSSKSGN